MASDQDIVIGVTAGLARFIADVPGAVVDQEQFARAVQLANEVNAEQLGSWSSRGARLYAEVLAMGAFSRNHYREGPMNGEQARAFAGWLTEIGNSWFHLDLPPSP